MNQDCSTPWIQYYYKGWNNDQYGIRCFYDQANADLYICTPGETLCYSEKLGQFVSFFDYHHPIGMFNIDSEYYALNYPDNDDSSSSVILWGMFRGEYNIFFDKMYQTDFTFISNENPLDDKIFTNIELRGDFRYWNRQNPILGTTDIYSNEANHRIDHRRMFDTVRVWDEYQDTGDIDLKFIDDSPSNMKKKFRIWRMDISRDVADGKSRIRNTWAKIKFVMNRPMPHNLSEMCGKSVSDYLVYSNTVNDWIDLDFIEDESRRFWYDKANSRIEETQRKGNNWQAVAYYSYADNDGMVINRIDAVRMESKPYAYRKLYDMEIHDIGVVYYA
jgi:hypothetical protein